MTRTLAGAPLAALLLLAAAPSPAPTVARQSLSVVCEHTPLWLYPADESRPRRAAVPEATLGTRFALLSGPRAAVSGFQFYETGVPAIEPGFAGQHYWLSQACALPV